LLIRGYTGLFAWTKFRLKKIKQLSRISATVGSSQRDFKRGPFQVDRQIRENGETAIRLIVSPIEAPGGMLYRRLFHHILNCDPHSRPNGSDCGKRAGISTLSRKKRDGSFL
jgi:hypothetical protein